jgi:phosphatidylserine decarboxylase
VKFATGSLRIAVVPAAAGALVAPVSLPVAGALLLVTVAILWFHRDPDRETPSEGVVAPADGRVAVVRTEGDRVRLGIYMRGRDVHVNRAPMDGVVEAVEHEPGANKLAFRKESERNERLRFRFEDVTAEMIAGAFARRTYSYVEPGDAVERGERIGHISFSSRFDLLLPPAYDPADLTVEIDDRVTAGETVVARPRSEIEESEERAPAESRVEGRVSGGR